VSALVTTRDLTSCVLGLHDAGTGLTGRPLGRTHDGRDFVIDPFDAYEARLIDGPNTLVVGSLGSGKSTVVKLLLLRALERNRRALHRRSER
jgi:type IV secretory pathway VirB4 component